MNQNDAAFSSLLDSDGNSMLCGPASLAHRLLAARRASKSGFNTVRFWTTEEPFDDPTRIVFWLRNECRSVRSIGTKDSDFIDCMERAFQSSGAAPLGTRAGSLRARGHLTRARLLELRPRSQAAILQVGEYVVKPPRADLTWQAGHYVALYGVVRVADENDGTFTTIAFDPRIPPDEKAPKDLSHWNWSKFERPPWMPLEALPESTYALGWWPENGPFLLLHDVIVMPLSVEMH